MMSNKVKTIEQIDKEWKDNNEKERIRKSKPTAIMRRILDQYGIKLSIRGCGCCGSPTVSFEHNGEVILDDEDCFDFSTDNF